MNDAWLQFKSIFQNTIDQCVPTYKPKEKKSLYSNSEVFNLKRRKNHLWKRYLSIRSAADLSNFKSVNNQLRSLTRNLRKDYEKRLSQGVKSRPKAFWQYVNSRTKIRHVLLNCFLPMVLQYTPIPKWLPFLMNISPTCLPVKTPQLFLQLIQPVPLFLMIPLRLLLQLYSISLWLCKVTNLLNLMGGLYLLLNL